MGQAHTVNRVIDLACEQAIAIELRHVLPSGWKVTEESDTFVIRGELSEASQDQLWRIVRFVAYPTFFSLQQTHKAADELRYEMVSASADGSGFRIEFILAKAGGPHPRGEKSPAA